MSELTYQLNRAARLVFGRIDTTDPRRRRLFGILQGVVTSLGNKLIVMAVSFLSVPLTIGYLGREQYGVWVTLGSLLAWLALTDFGLGNGLGNAVTTAAGRERHDLVRMHLSNGIFLLTAIALGVGLLAILAWPFIDWNAVLGVTSEAGRAEVGNAVAITLAIFLLKFPLQLTGKVFLAYQDGKLGNYWGAAGNVLSVVVLLIVTRTHGGLVWLAFAVAGTPLLIGLASSAWLFLVQRPNLMPGLGYVDFQEMRQLGQVGGKFFLIQVLGLITFQTDNFVIGHFLGADSVPAYSLTYTLFSYTSLPQSLLFAYLWSAYTEAIARGDIDWVRRTFRMNLGYGMIFTALVVCAIAFITKPFIGWWAGLDVVPSTALIGWMAAWAMINAFTNPIACLLAAASYLKNQTIYSAATTLVNIPLTIYLVQVWGVAGVIAGTVIGYALFMCIPIFIDVQVLLTRLRKSQDFIEQPQ